MTEIMIFHIIPNKIDTTIVETYDIMFTIDAVQRTDSARVIVRNFNLGTDLRIHFHKILFVHIFLTKDINPPDLFLFVITLI